MTSIFEGQPPKTSENKAFSNQNKGPIWGSRYTYTLQGTDISPGSTKRDPGKSKSTQSRASC